MEQGIQNEGGNKTKVLIASGHADYQTDARPANDERNLVTWDSAHDQQNPRNWPKHRKWLTTFIVSLFAFISPVVSTMIAPAVDTISQEFHVTEPIEGQLMLSVFVLAYCFGPFLFAPLSELYGRRMVLQGGNMLFLAFNLGCGFTKNSTQMIICRFLAGLGGSAPVSLGSGVIADIWEPNQRGRAVALYSLTPLLGPTIGPIAGAFITQTTTWRWCFWSTSVACGSVQALSWFLLQETFAPEILRKKRLAAVRESGRRDLDTEFDCDRDESRSQHILAAMSQPFRLLGTQPILMILTLFVAYLYGIAYLILASFPALWTSPEYYDQSVGIGSLNYISLAVGMLIGTQVAAPCSDKVFSRLTANNDQVAIPEFRIPLMIPGSICIPIGLLLYGWTSQEKMHWILPNTGTAIFTCGVVVVSQCVQTYIVDAYTRYAASAVAASVALRSLCGFAFPLFAPYLHAAIGYGWTSTLLGVIATIVGIPVPMLLWKYGPTLRAKSGVQSHPTVSKDDH